MRSMREVCVLLCVVVLLVTVSGCAGQKEYDRINRAQSLTIMNLNDEVNHLNEEMQEILAARSKLAKTKELLDDRLKEELAKGDLQVEMKDKGLVVTVLNKVLFDSGMTTLKKSSLKTLDKVANILADDVPDQIVFIEGHTDTDPIKRSGFKSNWELSTARSTEVIHFFTDQAGIDPRRFVAAGYSEFHPIASNMSSQGKSRNRRVEIVISPKSFIKEFLAADKEQEGAL